MGRPRKNEEDRRTVQVNIRLTQQEYGEVRRYAAACNLSPANWIRRKSFTGRFPAVKSSPLDAAIYRELQKIGVNLNQATRRINSGDLPEHYFDVLAGLSAQLSRMIKLLVDDGQPGKG